MNRNYKVIIDAGYGIEIRSQQFSMARAYLTKDGVRTGASSTFKSGHYNAEAVAEKAINTRSDTHLDRALAFLASQVSSTSVGTNSIAPRRNETAIGTGATSIGALIK